MAERKAEIPVDKELRDRLKTLKGNLTWDQYFDKLLNNGVKKRGS